MSMGSHTWKGMPRMNHGRDKFGMTYLSQIGTIAIGGLNPHSETGELYDNKWNPIANIPLEKIRYHCTTPFGQNKLIVIGGYQNGWVSEMSLI